MKAINMKDAIKTITTHYIDGAFVKSHGREVMDIINPTNRKVIARVILADEDDTQLAIAAAKRAFATFGRTTKEERAEILRQLHEVVSARVDDLTDAMVEEYGGTAVFSRIMMQAAGNVFLSAEKALQELPLTRNWGKTTVTLEPVGVAGLITPWNANSFFLSAKLASAVAAGCTAVIKPSELSAQWQGRSGSPLPNWRPAFSAGGPEGCSATYHPAQALRASWSRRVQSYIRKGIEEGAQVLVGGEGHPKGLETGYFVKPTVFVDVKNDMTIAKEEIFGPMLSVIAYDNEDEAIRIANDTNFGLHAYVNGTDVGRARRVASRILAGRVAINGMLDDQQAPFGGFKHSGVGREFGTFGIEAFLEPRAILE